MLSIQARLTQHNSLCKSSHMVTQSGIHGEARSGCGRTEAEVVDAVGRVQLAVCLAHFADEQTQLKVEFVGGALQQLCLVRFGGRGGPPLPAPRPLRLHHPILLRHPLPPCVHPEHVLEHHVGVGRRLLWRRRSRRHDGGRRRRLATLARARSPARSPLGAAPLRLAVSRRVDTCQSNQQLSIKPTTVNQSRILATRSLVRHYV